MKMEIEDEEDKMSEEEKQVWLEKLQEDAAVKQVSRTETMGQLLRSKGFLWIATSHNIIGGWQQAGNVIRIESESPWMCEMREMWEDTPSAELVYKDMRQPSGEEWKYADRRQELVFIGQGLKHATIQQVLDRCLLNDEEMEMGPEKWEEVFADVDKIQLSLDYMEEDEDEEDEDEEENGGTEGVRTNNGSESSPGPTKKKTKSQ